MSINTERANPLQIHMQPKFWSGDQRMIHDQNMRMPRDPDGTPLLNAFPLTQNQIQRIDTFGTHGDTFHFPPPHDSQFSPYLHSMQVVDLPLSTREKMSLEPSVPSKRYSSFSQDNLRETSRPRLENTGLDTYETGRETLQKKLKDSIQGNQESPNHVVIPNPYKPYAIISEEYIRQLPSFQREQYFEHNYAHQVQDNLKMLAESMQSPQNTIPKNILRHEISNNNYSWLKQIKLPVDGFGDIPPQNILEFLSRYSLSLKQEQIQLLYDILVYEITKKAADIEDDKKKRAFKTREKNRLNILWRTVFNI